MSDNELPRPVTHSLCDCSDATYESDSNATYESEREVPLPGLVEDSDDEILPRPVLDADNFGDVIPVPIPKIKRRDRVSLNVRRLAKDVRETLARKCCTNNCFG